MARKKRNRPMAGEIPLDSFSDIAFLLIIFFMVATVLTETQGFLTDLPAGKENAASAETKVPSVILSGAQITYNGTAITLSDLRRTLHELKLADKPEPTQRVVQLETSPTTEWRDYFPVWAAIAKAGGVVALVEPEE